MTPFESHVWAQLESLLDEALDLEPAQREPWLLELASRDAEVARTLRTLLNKHDQLNAREYLESPVSAQTRLEVLDIPQAGRQIGAYTLDCLIGRGGMGEVWLASRSDGRFEGKCAIKLLDDSGASGKLAERIRGEARMLARLGHPNIARLLDAGVTDEGTQFLVLEYVDGEPIDRYCDAKALTIRERVRLFVDVVGAVAHAHSQLIVHRDLKPSNVFVTRDGTVKLLDFGIAKLLRQDTTATQDNVTRVEDAAFTPEYAAPEQLLGEILSTATDVYQLGMVLYILLVGQHPIRPSGTRRERIKAALAGIVPRASSLAEGSRRRELTGDLDAILEMALQTEATQRYLTAAALREELLRYLNGEPVSARRGAAFYRTRKWFARYRFGATVSVVAFIALCAAMIVAFQQARSARVARERAVTLSSRNQAVSEFLGRVIAEAAESKKAVTVSEMLARSEQLALRNSSANVENRAAVLAMIAERYDQFNDAAHASKLLEVALALLKASPDHAMRSRLQCRLVVINADFDTADAAIRRISQEIGGPAADPEADAHCLCDLGRIYGNLEDGPALLRSAERGLQRLHEAASPSGMLEATLLGRMASGYRLSGRNGLAEAYFEQAFAKFAELGAENSDGSIAMMNDSAVALFAAGVPRRALEIDERIERLERAREPGNEPSTVIVGNRGQALLALGRFDEARNAFELECRLAKERGDRSDEAHCLVGFASHALQTRSLDRAAEYLDRWERLPDASAPPGSPPRIGHALRRSELELARGHIDAARAQLARVLPSSAVNRTTFYAQLQSAELHLLEKKPRDAATSARRALEIATALQGDFPHSLYAGLAWLMIGRADLDLDQQTQARAALVKAIEQLSNTVDADHPELLRARELL